MVTNENRRNRRRAAPDPMAHAFTIPDAQAMGMPGKSTIYRMIAKGELATIKVAGRRMLVGTSVRRILGVQPQ